MSLYIYLPQDRLRALANHITLPDRTNGTALFADISGFTPLTEALRNSLGPRRGGEELTLRIEAVYSSLITQATVGVILASMMVSQSRVAVTPHSPISSPTRPQAGLWTQCGEFHQSTSRESRVSGSNRAQVGRALRS